MSILVAIFRGVGRILAALDRLGAKLDQLEAKLDRTLALLEPAPATSFIFCATIENQHFEGVTMLQITDSQRSVLTIRPVDKKGKLALLDGVATWAGSDDTVFTVTPGTIDPETKTVVQSPDGLSAVIEGVAPGSGRVTVTGDADMGTGVQPITGILDITVTPGNAISIEVVAGEPSEL